MFVHVRFQPVATQQVPEDGPIGRHCEVLNAHAGPITAITMTEQGIYSASLDKTLKRWKPVKGADGRFSLTAELNVQLPDSCHALLFHSGWLFCGLWNGTIKAFSTEGAEMVLNGHHKRVTALKIHQAILVSGSADREVRLWQMDPQSKVFACTHTITDSMPGCITKLHILGDNLWVGGSSGVAICNLGSLQVTNILPPTKQVGDYLEFQGHLIVAYTDGSIRIFGADGSVKTDMKPLAGGPVLSLAGLDSGPRVLCGHAHGQISSILLPSFEFRTQFQALENAKVEALCCAGHDGIFLVGGSNGSLQLWQRIGA